MILCCSRTATRKRSPISRRIPICRSLWVYWSIPAGASGGCWMRRSAAHCALPIYDFVLQQDGHPQTITYFAPDSDLPLTLGLLVDTSGSQRRLLDQEERSTLRSSDL